LTVIAIRDKVVSEVVKDFISYTLIITSMIREILMIAFLLVALGTNIYIIVDFIRA